jgi:hypothetical protein
VQQLACAYLPHGYWFYVTGFIPERKDPREVDERIIAKYGIAISRQARARRKLAGFANLQYLRHERFFVILATRGAHAFLDAEQKSIRDVRRVPIQYAGYSVGYRHGQYKRKNDAQAPAERDDKWHARVQIGRERYLELKAYFLELTRHRSSDALSRELYAIPFEPYAPVRQQLLNILRLVNNTRRAAGYELLPPSVLRYQRRIVKPFAWPKAEESVCNPRDPENEKGGLPAPFSRNSVSHGRSGSADSSRTRDEEPVF